MHALPALHGKTLPLVFTQGYLDGLWTAVGGGSRTAAYQSAAQALVPDPTLRQRWLAPLLAYFQRTAHAPQALDYRFIALFQHGLYHIGPSFSKVAQVATRRAGNAWWWGEAPISPYQDTTSLQKQYAARLCAVLDTRKFGAPRVTIRNVQSGCALGILGVTTFLEHFQRDSAIALQVASARNTLTVEVHDCPFCLHEHDLCYVFMGIMSGLLGWLHGDPGRDPKRSRYLTLDEAYSTNHRIVIAIHPHGLRTKLPHAAS